MKNSCPTFAIILLKIKKLANGHHPVVVRAGFKGERKYYSLGFSAHPEAWNDAGGRYGSVEGKRRLSEDERQANHKLDAVSVRLKGISDYFNDVDFTFARFEEKFRNNTTGYVLEYFDTVIDELEADERLGSARAYQNTRDKLETFTKKDFKFQDVDRKFLQKFEAFTLKTCSPATTGIYLRSLRALINKAIDSGIINKDLYPFDSFKIATVKNRKKALSKEQLTNLKKHKALKGSQLWHSLNMFLFSYYARGMNLTDMAALKHANIDRGRIFYERQKTGSNIDLLIDDNIAQILSEYPGDGYIFPILEDGLTAKTARYRIHARLKKINAALKSIATEAGLPADVTFYFARHSYATALKRGGVPIAVISESFGHSSEAVTKNYLDSFETNQLDEISKHL